MNFGQITTYVSDAVLVLAVAYGVSVTEAALLVQGLIILGAIIVAFLDIKYPEFVDTCKTYIEKSETVV